MGMEVIKRPDRSVRKAKFYIVTNVQSGARNTVVNLDFLTEHDKQQMINAVLQGREIIKAKKLRSDPIVNIDKWDHVNAGLRKKGVIHTDQPMRVYVQMGNEEFDFILKVGPKS